MEQLSLPQLKSIIPSSLRSGITQEMLDSINKILTDEGMATAFKENIISFTSVLQEGKFTITEYINAVKYVSYKAMGDTARVAYAKTFPERYARWKQQALEDKRIASYVSIYNQTKLVTMITEKLLVPSWILNQDYFQAAINTQAQLMTDPKVSPMVRTKAADSLLNILKRPETQKLELQVTQKESDSMIDLHASLRELVNAQKEAIKSGSFSAKEIAEKPLIVEGTYEEKDS